MRRTDRSISRPLRAGGAFLLALAALAAAPSLGAAPAGAAPPILIDLDGWDRAKKTVQLPNGIALGYLEQGNPKGRPVVLIHGYTDNARDWVPLIPFLDQGDRLIVVDIRGHGRSSKPECCYAIVDFAYDIKLLLDALQIAKADIVGHSLGSIVSQAFAETWPERTRRVVLVSSTGGTRPAEPGKAPAKPVGMDFKASIVKLKDPIDPESPFMVEWYASPTPVNEDFLKRQRKDAAAIPVKVWLAVLEQGIGAFNLQAGLPRLKAPTLLIWGAKDPIFGAEDRASLQAALPSAKVVLYPDLGHNSFWEAPERVARDVNGFLAD